MLTGVYGAFATGKSQLAHQLAEWFAAHAVSSPRWVYFFDTENTFRPERIADMAAPREHDQATVLQHIRHIEAANLTQIKALIRRFDNLASEEPPALVVVDSLSNPFRREVGGEQPNLHRLHRDFIQVLEKLEGIARTYAIPVFLTSQVSSKPGSGLTGAPRSVSKPFMNNLWSHFVKASCFLEDAEELVGGPRGPRLLRATLMNHGTQPNQTMDYIIRVSGLEGV
jgi:RecA/RadA recombinase